MKRKVYFLQDAEQDLIEIAWYIKTHDSVEKAQLLIHRIESACKGLSEYANRGHIPPEMEDIGVHDYQEIHSKPYRIVYKIMDSNVFIHCILDGRCELQELLQKRLLR